MPAPLLSISETHSNHKLPFLLLNLLIEAYMYAPVLILASFTLLADKDAL
jgi:hypothetical protein